MPYTGPERRVHTVYLTQNREYHTRGNAVVAVRDRLTRAWMPGHEAIGMRLGTPNGGQPVVGEPVTFLSMSSRIRTSAVTEVARPEKETVEYYELIRSAVPEDELETMPNRAWEG